LVCSVSMLID